MKNERMIQFPMKSLHGWVLVVTAVLGWLVSIVGITGVWVLRPITIRAVSGAVQAAVQTLDSTTRMLTVVDTSLAKASESVAGIQKLIEATAETVKKTTPMIDSVGGIMGDQISGVVENTQTSLESLTGVAKVVDETLRLLSQIPLLKVDYRPSETLDLSISAVAEDMKGLPDSFKQIQVNLDSTMTDLNLIQKNLNALTDSVGQIDNSLKDARKVVGEYRITVTDLHERLTGLQPRIPLIFTLGSVFATLFFLWMFLAQVNLFADGLAKIR